MEREYNGRPGLLDLQDRCGGWSESGNPLERCPSVVTRGVPADTSRFSVSIPLYA